MTMIVSTPVTGAAQTGFTSPTYTLIADSNPSASSKRWIVSGIGGTQVGVTLHTASAQFALEVEKPAQIRQIGSPAANGLISNVPSNKYKVVTLKSVLPASGQLPRGAVIRTEMSIPAGSETYDAANVKAAISLHIGALSQLSAGIGDTVMSGVLG